MKNNSNNTFIKTTFATYFFKTHHFMAIIMKSDKMFTNVYKMFFGGKLMFLGDLYVGKGFILPN